MGRRGLSRRDHSCAYLTCHKGGSVDEETHRHCRGRSRDAGGCPSPDDWTRRIRVPDSSGRDLHMLTRNIGGVNELVLEWNGVQYFGATANTLTFQAILRSDGSMQFNYPDTSGPAGQSDGQSASIGLHDLNGGGATNRYLQW